MVGAYHGVKARPGRVRSRGGSGVAWWLLRQPEWKAAFWHDVPEVPIEPQPPEEEGYAEARREEEREPALH